MRLEEWQVVLAFGFAAGSATTLLAQRALSLARKWLRAGWFIFAVAGLAATAPACAVIAPVAFGIRAAGAAAGTAHGAWRLSKATKPAPQPASYPAGDCRR